MRALSHTPGEEPALDRALLTARRPCRKTWSMSMAAAPVLQSLIIDSRAALPLSRPLLTPRR
jgi:hypothetical protein